MSTTETSVPETSRDRFIEELNIHLNAGVGVTFVRTREPFEVIDLVRSMAFAEENTAFKSWSMTQGWATYERSSADQEPSFDNMTQPMLATAKLAIKDEDSGGFPQEGYYCMMWTHFPLKQSAVPPLIQLLAELARQLPETNKRLILVMPPDLEIPKELEDCIPIIDHQVPVMEELRSSYDNILLSLPDSRRPSYDDDQVMSILNAGVGMTTLEFESAVTRATVEFRNLLPAIPITDMVRSVSKIKTQVVKRSEVLEVMPVGNMSEVGGLDALKAWIRARKYAFSKEAREHGVDTPKGIALIGPPGTGKSLGGKAIASELGLQLVRFDVSRVFAGIVGQSEGRVRAALQMLDALSPCVVLLDEVDKAFNMNTGGGDSGVGSRILGAILTHMQETKSPLFWVMTANRTGGLPPELLRKGRLDEVWSVTLPDADERREIFKIHLEKRGWSIDHVEDIAQAITRSANYVPAEIEAAVKEAITTNYAAWKEANDGSEIGRITGAMLSDQFNNMRPLAEAFAESFEEMRRWAEQNARPASSRQAPTIEDAGPRVRDRGGVTALMKTPGQRRVRTGGQQLDG